MYDDKLNYGFVNWCQNEKDVLLDCIYTFASHIPSIMCKADFRHNISHFGCHVISRQYNKFGSGDTISSAKENGYDLIWSNKSRISVKIQEQCFQRKKKLSEELTTAPAIILKNKLGGNKDTPLDFEFDYLMSIQRGKTRSEIIPLAFGVISKEKLANHIMVASGDQIKVKLQNNQYDFFSGIKEYDCKINSNIDRDADLNHVFCNNLELIFEALCSLDDER